MSPGTKLGAFGLLLVAVLGGGAAVGTLAGPIGVGGDGGSHGTAHVGADEPAALPVGGVLTSQDGYSLVSEDRLADEGPFAFRILGPDGEVVSSFDVVHERQLHLIVASRDLRTFHHLHPLRDAAGHWTATLPALPAGAYRAIADFRPTGGPALTLGIDLTAPGPVGPPTPVTAVDEVAVDGFDVRLDGDLTAGTDSTVTITVRRDGAVVATEPYLGAAGHLVALRDGDLAYLHVHPLDDEPTGPVSFALEVPSPGTYALFFDFVVDGSVRTARFVVTAPATTAHEPGH